MNTKEAAEALKVSPRRVRAMAASGVISARKSGGSWKISSAKPTSSLGRPLSSESRAALTDALTKGTLSGLKGQLRVRTAARIGALRKSDNPDQLLSRWWGGAAPSGIGTGQTMVHRAQAGDALTVKMLLRRREEFLQDPTDLADVVSSERSILKLSQADLADRAGVDVSVVKQIERGEGISSPGPARRVLRELAVDVAALPSISVAL